MSRGEFRTVVPHFTKRMIRVLVVSTALSWSVQGLAQIEEVIVTAQKREQSLEDVSIAVTALPEEALQDRDIRDFDTYLRSVPGTSFANQGNQGSEIKIRGVGNGTSRLSPTVAIYLGEVPVIHNGRSINSSYDFYITDMARIEVLRGPQGQLYGSNSLGGAIKNIPNKPDLSAMSISGSASGSSMHGGGDSFNGDMTFNIPVTDSMGLRLTGYGARQAGWIDNVFAGGTRIGPPPSSCEHPDLPQTPGCGPLTQLDSDLYQIPILQSVAAVTQEPARFLTDLVHKVRDHNNADLLRVTDYVSPSNADEDVNETDRVGVRGLFTWEATDALTLDLMLAYEHKENSGTSWVTEVPASMTGPYPSQGQGPQKTYSIPRTQVLGPDGILRRPRRSVALYPTSATKYQQANSVDAGNTDEILLANFVVNWDLNFAVLTSSTSYWDRTEELETPLPLSMIATGVDGIWPVINHREDNPQAYIQELRLTSTDEGPLTWLGGAFWSKITQDFTIDIQDPTGFMMVNMWPPRPTQWAPGVGPPWPVDSEIGTTLGDFEDKQVALFGEIAYDILPTINAAASVRWYDIEQRADITYSGPVFNGGLINTPTHRKSTDSGWLPKVTLSWTPNDDARVYATVSEGYRSGVTNEDVPVSSCQRALDAAGYPEGVPDTDPDTVWNYELGAKMTFADRRYSVNGAIYKVDWKDLQSQVFLQGFDLPVVGDVFSGLCTYDRLFNVGDAKIWGAEVEGVAQVTDQVRIDTALGYTHGKYDEGFPQLGITAGDTIEGTAKFTSYIGAQYDFDAFGKASFVRADWTYTGDISKKPTDFLSQPLVYDIGDFHTVNMRTGVSFTEQLRAELFVTNLFDDFGVTRAIDLAGAAFPTYFTIPPRAVGLLVRFNY